MARIANPLQQSHIHSFENKREHEKKFYQHETDNFNFNNLLLDTKFGIFAASSIGTKYENSIDNY